MPGHVAAGRAERSGRDQRRHLPDRPDGCEGDVRPGDHTLGSARAAIEACGEEVRRLGLVLNERKTLTYRVSKYRRSLGAFADAEQRLFADAGHSPADLTLLDEDYGGDDADADAQETFRFGETPVDSSVDDDEAIVWDEEAPSAHAEVAEPRWRAARRALDIWMEEDESDEAQSNQDAAITESLLGRALPVLGAAGDDGPLEIIDQILRYEPTLTPQVWRAYLTAYGVTGRLARAAIRTVLDDVAGQDIFSVCRPCRRLAAVCSAEHHFSDQPETRQTRGRRPGGCSAAALQRDPREREVSVP